MNNDHDNNQNQGSVPEENQSVQVMHSLLVARYDLQEPIGRGRYATVYSGRDLCTGDVVAIKITPPGNVQHITREAAVYREIQYRFGIRSGFPYFCCSGVLGDGTGYLVMEMLGATLHGMLANHYAAHGRFLSMRRVARIGIRLVEHLKDLHRAGFMHCHIKPNNVLCDSRLENRVCLIDFGLAKKIADRGGRVLVHNDRTGVNGFSSLTTILGGLPGRRDDLESLGFCLVYLRNGRLPWHMGRNIVINEVAHRFSLAMICEGFGQHMENYFRYLRNLTYSDEPDYTYLIGCLRSLQSSQN